ncbi:hypothetical protein MRX96_005927 [Rhipicephalus microplus]
MGQRTLKYLTFVPDTPDCGWLHILPHQNHGLPVVTTSPGIRAECNASQCTLQEKAAAIIEERLSDHVFVFTDGLVTEDGLAVTASVILSLVLHGKCWLHFTADQLAGYYYHQQQCCATRAPQFSPSRGENAAPQ